MIDSREQNRVKASPVLRYWTKDRFMMISHANNLSERGISFNTGKEYKKGTPVYIQMKSPMRIGEDITFRAKVVHQEKNEETDLFKTGAEIVDFHDKDKNILSQYINFMKNIKH